MPYLIVSDPLCSWFAPDLLGRARGAWSLLLACLLANACGGTPSTDLDGTPRATGGSAGMPAWCTTARPDLVINEISSNNDGNAVDELGNADDWVEIVNRGTTTAQLGQVTLDVGGRHAALPNLDVAPGDRAVFWADEQPEQGPNHLPFKFSAGGFILTAAHCGKTLERVAVPALDTNAVYARHPDGEGALNVCRYASAHRTNGTDCEPPKPPPLVDEHRYAPYEWTLPHPPIPSPLVIDELALRPAAFIELRNTSAEPLELERYQLTVAPIHPGQPWPSPSEGIALTLGTGRVLNPDERVTISVTDSDVAAIAAQTSFEGVVTLFSEDGGVVDRVDFARWPESAVLARTPAYPGRLVFCSPASPELANDGCGIVPSRDVGDYVRHLRTPSDFEALAAGGGELGIASVKFIVDMAAGNQVYLVGSREWSLHYEFIRELIEQQPHLNRCDPTENLIFNRGWSDFSVKEYFQGTGRRYLLGTLVHHAATDLLTVEFTFGDAILAEDMRRAFFAVTGHVLVPERFHLRPQDASQTARALSIEGTLPIVGTNAPFVDTKLQPLTAAVGYGVLTHIPAAELETASLGQDVIVVTDDVPNDIPLVGGLVTEAFQTPLSHVNLLCQNRGTPNLALPNAHSQPDFSSLFGQLVRFEVTADGYHLTPAAAEEAQAFWDSRRPTTVQLVPRLDADRADVVDLSQASLADLPAIGAKAAQLAEVIRLSNSYQPNCAGAQPFVVPSPAFAIPMSYFLFHMERSGAKALLEALLSDPDALANRTRRHELLAELRGTLTSSPVDPAVLASLTTFLERNYGSTRVRLRSSSNTEDLAGFNGAGLYTSTSAAIGDPSYPLADALREVWASIFSNRGFDERQLANVDQRTVAMGVLIHPAFPEERANGVVISRNLEDVTRGDIYSFNVQLGEASVTNPAPGITSDQFTYQWPPRKPAIGIKSVSTFNDSLPILSDSEIVSTACAMRGIVDHFRPLLDPEGANPYFTMDMEFKLLGASRNLLIKQARPFAFGAWEDPGDCRDFNN